MRDKILKALAKLHDLHPWKMVIVVVTITIIMGAFATQLEQSMRWTDLLPAKSEKTIQYNKVINGFITATNIIIVVEGEEEKIKAFAEAVVPQIKLATDPKDGKLYAKRIDYKQDVDFIREHGLMLVKEDDLQNMKELYQNPNLVPLLTNINNIFEKEYIGQEESISTRTKEDNTIIILDGISNMILVMKNFASGKTHSPEDAQKAVDKLLLGEPYLLSYDKQALILNVIPNFNMTDMGKMISGTDAIQKVIDKVVKDFPEVKTGLTGMIPLGRDEMVYGEQSMGYTSIIAFIAILILLILSFRMWAAPLFAIFNLAVGLIWAIGLAAILVKSLNIMTSMVTVILIGLGIDFSIHIISIFTESRSLGKPINKSIEDTFLKSGKGILTGGLTTCAAFFALIISSSRGMKEVGIVSSVGLFSILIVTFLFLPSLLVLRERRLEKKLVEGKIKSKPVYQDISFRAFGKGCSWLSGRYTATIICALLITIFLLVSASRISFDHNYMNMEPKGLTSITLQDTILDKFDLSMDYALILTDSVEESREMTKVLKNIKSAAIIDDISMYLPSLGEQQKRIPYIQEINRAISSAVITNKIFDTELNQIISELDRLEMNIMEIQDMAYIGGQDKVDRKCSEIVGNPDNPRSFSIIVQLIDFLENNRQSGLKGLEEFQKYAAPYFKESVLKIASTENIALDDLPASVLDRYANRDRTQFLLTVFPAENMWTDINFLQRFTSDLDKVSNKATGMPPVMQELIRVIGNDGKNAALLTVFVVFLLLWLDFRSFKYAIIAMIPLVAGVIWMVGLMHLIGMQLTVVNVMGLPLIIGIGIDYGVHIVHRWRIEGSKKVKQIFASTGKAIFLTSITTMLAFGSLVFSIWRGFGSLGAAMFIGVGACFLSTAIILAGIIGWLERKLNK
jgi:predicted RND superfamily exporter protein